MERLDCAVIGAGVVGLACARALARAGREVVVLEAEDAIGTHTSSRNSEVIHAGIYYPTGSLRARMCVAGKQALYRYCAERGIEHRRCGKVIVAVTDAEVGTLEKYLAQANANGVDDLTWMSREEVHAIEPNVRCVRGLYSPSTGIVDSHGLMLAYLGEVEERGGALVLESPVRGGRVHDDSIELEVGGREPMRVRCTTVVNCAGLTAPSLARCIEGIPPQSIPPQHACKGHYYTLSGKAPFSRHIYPVGSGLWHGVHVTVDLGGQVKFGPDLDWEHTADYAFDTSREADFYRAIREYYPALAEGALQPGYTGMRPKITAKGEPAADFRIDGPALHGVPGWIALYGIESPGLTASIAIGEMVAALAGG